MKVFCLAILIALSVVGVSEASLAYAFRFSPSAPVGVGPQEVSIYLDEVATGEATKLDVYGLATANFAVQLSNPLAFTGATTGFVDDPVFGLTSASVDLTTAGIVSFAQNTFDVPSLANGTLGTSTFPNIASILLGKVKFDLSLADSGTLTTVNIAANDFLLGDLSSVNSIASATFNITAVPEPTSMVFAGILGVSGLLTYRRRRQKKKA